MALTTNIVFGSMQPHPVQWQAPRIFFPDDSSVVAFRKCGPPMVGMLMLYSPLFHGYESWISHRITIYFHTRECSWEGFQKVAQVGDNGEI